MRKLALETIDLAKVRHAYKSLVHGVVVTVISRTRISSATILVPWNVVFVLLFTQMKGPTSHIRKERSTKRTWHDARRATSKRRS